jgi:hypothetical protein
LSRIFRVGFALVLGLIERLGHQAELDDEVAGQVLGFDFAALFPPEAEQGGLIAAQIGASVGLLSYYAQPAKSFLTYLTCGNYMIS